jgi:hypothetical protein
MCMYDAIKELHREQVSKAVQDERERVHKILGREFSKLLGSGQRDVSKLILKIDREVRNGVDGSNGARIREVL